MFYSKNRAKFLFCWLPIFYRFCRVSVFGHCVRFCVPFCLFTYSLNASAGKERVMRDAGNSDPAMAIALMSR